MNSEGHQTSARIVNAHIGGVFNEANLLAGAVDPDTHESGREYTGIESKHHFDISGNGRFHTADDICKIVFSYSVLARTYWLSGNRNEASFIFGIATHYYLDGFICSPSADEEAHSRGDRVFRNKAVKLEKTGSGIVPVSSQKSGSARYAHELAALLQDHFGKTDPNDLPRALGVLAELGRIVTDNAPYPPEFEEKLKEILSQCRLDVKGTCQEVQNKVHNDYQHFTETRKELLRNFDNLFYYVNDILLDRKHNQTVLLWKFLHLKIPKHEPYYEIGPEIQNALHDSRKAMQTVQSQTRNSRSKIMASRPEDGWYSSNAISDCAERYADSVNQLAQQTENAIESMGNKVTQGYETTVRRQDKLAIGWFLSHYESRLWESSAERDKAESLAGDQVNRFLPWIITLPIGFIGSLLCLLIGVIWCLLALVVALLAGMLLTFLMRKRLDLAYKWEALERLKRDIQYGQGSSAEKIVPKTKPQ